MGQMDSMDYIREDMPRSMRQSQMEHEARELGRQRPDCLPLFCHLIQAYSPAMKPYSVLAARPNGLTDGEWRAWAELRWSYVLWSQGEDSASRR